MAQRKRKPTDQESARIKLSIGVNGTQVFLKISVKNMDIVCPMSPAQAREIAEDIRDAAAEIDPVEPLTFTPSTN